MNKLRWLIAIFILTTTTLRAQDATGYYDFSPVIGGYDVGSFIVITKKDISTPLISRDALDKHLSDKDILKLIDLGRLPRTTQTLNVTKQLTQNVTLDSAIKKVSDAEIKLNLQRIRTSKIEVAEGQRISFSLGSQGAIQRMLGCLPKEDLILIHNTYQQNKKRLYIITEVIQYNQATANYLWKNDVSLQLQAKIAAFLGLNGVGRWASSKEYVVTYNTPIKVQFKALKFGEPLEKILLEELVKRNTLAVPCPPPPPPNPPALPRLLTANTSFHTDGDNNERGAVTIQIWQNQTMLAEFSPPIQHWRDPSRINVNFGINREFDPSQPVFARIKLCDVPDRDHDIRWRFHVAISIGRSDGSSISLSKNNIVLDTSGPGNANCHQDDVNP